MNSSSPPLCPKLQSGNGRIVVSTHASKAVFKELSSTYPLKLLSPNVTVNGLAVVYLLSYGGGLVGGDEIFLSVDVQDDANLVLLSQGSTKVFKMRTGTRLASIKKESLADGSLTAQIMHYTIGGDAGLFLLPEPVTCFRSASYKQIQNFDLAANASLVLLDSITSGRQSLGEQWDFSRYYSVNELRVGGRLIAKDVMLLDDPGPDPSGARIPRRPLREQLAPYSCFAMVILYGPRVQETIEDISAQYREMVVYQQKAPPNTIWSFSQLGSSSAEGAIVRFAGKETEMVRSSLKGILRRLDRIIGVDVYRRAFS